MPKDRDKAICQMCGEEIEYIEPTFGNALWTHCNSCPRHPATPKDREEQMTMKQLQIYYDAMLPLIDFIKRLVAVEIDRPDVEAHVVLQKWDMARAKAHEK